MTALVALCLLADPAVSALFARMIEDLSAGDSTSFLAHFDKSMPGYGDLEANVTGLTQQAEVASSLDIVSDDGDGERRTVELDWILRVTGKAPAAPSERREQRVRCKLARRGDQWKIVGFEPIAFLAPPRAG